jgi:micrococcal nuclease
MKQSNTLLKTLLVLGLGALLAHFGLNVPKDQVEEVVDGVVVEVGKRAAKKDKAGVTLQQPEPHEVLSVIDGDTLTVLIDGQKETVRVLGINTPETKYSSRGAECFGAEASEYAKSLLEGAQVTLEQDPSQDTRDKYNRILAYVGLPDGRDFGQVMIVDGYAYEYTYHGNANKNQSLYKEAQSQAKEAKAGLWADGACQG